MEQSTVPVLRLLLISTASSASEEEGNTKQFAQKRFLSKCVKAKLVEDVVFIGVETIEKVVNDKGDHAPLIRHVKYLAEKATNEMFEAQAYIKYNEVVRERAINKGVTQFSIIITDEVFSHFSLENTVKVPQKTENKARGGRGSSKWGSSGKSETICICFNNYDIGCKGRCNFVHQCYVCDSKDHGKKDCPKKSGRKLGIAGKSKPGGAVSNIVLNLSNGDVTTGCNRPSLSHGSIFRSSHKVDKVLLSERNLVQIDAHKVL